MCVCLWCARTCVSLCTWTCWHLPRLLSTLVFFFSGEGDRFSLILKSISSIDLQANEFQRFICLCPPRLGFPHMPLYLTFTWVPRIQNQVLFVQSRQLTCAISSVPIPDTLKTLTPYRSSYALKIGVIHMRGRMWCSTRVSLRFCSFWFPLLGWVGG